MNTRTLIFKITRKYLRFLPDSLYLKLLYWGYTGRMLNLKNPLRFTEKIQWLKLYNREPIYTTMVDKVAAKKWASDKIGTDYIIPTIAIYDKWDDIDFKLLPDCFVIKTSHGGGGSGVIVVKNKNNFDFEKSKKIIENSLNDDGFSAYRGFQYRGVPKKIIIETYINESREDLMDYKFYCFNGTPLYCQVIRGRNTKETIDFYNMDWELMPFVGLNPYVENGKIPVEKPTKLKEMIEIAKKLSSGIPFLRVDLYYINNKVLFGETTFHPATGLGFFKPDKYDFIIGDLLKLPNNFSI